MNAAVKEHSRGPVLFLILGIAGFILTVGWFMKSRSPGPGPAPAPATAVDVDQPAHKTSRAQPATDPHPAEPAAKLLYQYGIQIAKVKLTAESNGFDVTYLVVDPSRAVFLPGDQADTFIVREDTGAKLTLTRQGLRRRAQVKPVQGETYLMQFANVDPTIQPGAKIAAVIGGIKIEGLTLE